MTSLDEPEAPDPPDGSPSAEESISEREEAERLRRAVTELPEDLRFTVSALYWGGLPVKEIAAIEEITTVAIRKRLHKAFTILEAALEKDLR
jgi:RNA polymerase sigma factor (sigma-70 family)